jgi:uncharacterized damage-inducible protein DinB
MFHFSDTSGMCILAPALNLKHMDGKELCKVYLDELKAESTATRKCLERIPESIYGFKPHPKSMEMGYLALLVAEIPKWITAIIELSVIDFANYQHFQLSTAPKLLAHYEENLKGAIQSLSTVSDESLQKPFDLRNGTTLLSSTPKLESISSTLNHWVHHRGQLTVYMRLKDIAVPSIYGPSADDRGGY